MNLVEKTNSRKKNVIILFTMLVTIVLAIIKYKSGEINYINSDATWHVLYTMKCFSETPFSVHKFLPLNSLGGIDNKYIPWGLTVLGDGGNYYYTSFSGIGYALPYLFVKIFHLGYTELSLYIFNTLLFVISSVILAFFLMDLFKKNKNSVLITVIGIIFYTMEPVLLHNMGITYWHQSIMQVTLLIQIYSYYRYRKYNSKNAYILFLIMTLLNPYIEWTGFVANLGFMIAELFSNWKQNYRVALVKAFSVAGLTILSGLLFCGHFLLNLSFKDFYSTMVERFGARSVTSKFSIANLFAGYWNSYKFSLPFLSLLFIINLLINKKHDRKYRSIFSENKYLLLVTLFPITENFLMKEHAILYTYDRMKLVFPIVLIICDLVASINNSYLPKYFTKVIAISSLIIGISNTLNYMSDQNFVWKTDFRRDNKLLAKSIEPYKKNAVLGSPVAVRAYVNMTFNHDIYEGQNPDNLILNTKNRGKRYGILLNSAKNKNSTMWYMWAFSSALIFDTEEGKVTELYLDNESISSRPVYGWFAASRTDNNWLLGVSRTNQEILFDYYPALMKELKSSKKLVLNENDFLEIKKVARTVDGIKVTVNSLNKNYQYPSFIVFEK